ncbi:Trafficking protein particle complex subunit 10, TRAPPC10 [Ceratobasidium sp. AG-Ba]|nr:Trafficking protein particle complex subunit 10, TRAPPC10 [Ceratobasidium sp. AG-Ba]
MQVPTPSRPSSVSAHSRAYTPGPTSPAVPGLASNGQVRITYTLAQSLQSSPHAAVITESLRSKLHPLRNLHWRPTAGTLPGSSIRTIQYLDAELVSLDLGPSTARLSTAEGFGGEAGRSQIPGTVLGKPFINLWLGMCDDADTYKNVIRRQLKDWVASVTTQSKRDQEWLIVLVNVTSPGQDDEGGFYLGEARQLNHTTGGAEDPAAWTDLIAKIKDAIITTLDGRVAERMDDVRRTEAQRAVPGWNFCTFFVLKESIAESFEGMTLLDAALVQYSELEASFYQVLKEKNLSWFGKLGGTSPGDDAAPLLSVTKKPYRDLIMSNAISVFDFRCYLLARQCLLLAKMGAVADVALKAARFISSFARTLRENENSLSEPFLESWIYSCSLNVVDECDAWILGASGQESISDAKDVSYNAAKHELLELARAQLDKIGIRAGHLPRVAPFTTSLPDQPPKSRPTSASFDPHAAASDLNDADYKRLSRAGVTNATLLQAIDSSEAFDELYKQLVGRVIETCVASGRTRHRGAVPDAKLVFSDLPTQYIEQHWPVLESYTRIQDLETSKDGEGHSTEEWIHRAMALLRADLAVPEDLRSKEVTARTQQLFEELLKRADGLSSDVTVNEFSPLVLRLVGDIARLDGTRDGSGLAVSVTNTLPITISLEYLKLTVVGPDGVQLLFEHWPTQLPSGDSMLMLLCPNPVLGLFTTAQHEYKISHLLFVEKAPETLDRSNLERKSLSEARAVIRIPDDERAVKVGMMMPRHVVLGDPRVLFQIHTGRNTLKTGTLTVSSQGGQIKFVLESAKVLGHDAITATFKPDRIAVENLPVDQVIVFSVPYVGAPRNDELEVTIEFEYTTAAQTEVVRVVKTKCRAYIGLPLIVNINDKFRNKKLFTNVVIHSANQELVRVAGVALKNTSDHGKLAVKACKRAPVSVVVRPTRPAPFLFQIESSDPNKPPVGETLQLIIVYRSLHEDIFKIVEHAVDLITTNGSNPRIRKQQRETIEATLLNETSWIDMLELIRLSDSSLDIETWAKQLVEKAPVKLDLASVIEAIEDLRRLDMESPLDTRDEDSSWRTVTMPFDVPLMNIINRVQITPKLATGSQTYAGQPVDVALTISSLFHWSGLGPESEKSCMMRYDMACETDSGWLVCGPKRGEYIAMDGAEHTTQLTLLPLRHGTLSLPIVSVEPIENFEGGGRPTCETWQADRAKKMTVLPRNAKSTFVVAMPVPVI